MLGGSLDGMGGAGAFAALSTLAAWRLGAATGAALLAAFVALAWRRHRRRAAARRAELVAAKLRKLFGDEHQAWTRGTVLVVARPGAATGREFDFMAESAYSRGRPWELQAAFQHLLAETQDRWSPSPIARNRHSAFMRDVAARYPQIVSFEEGPSDD